MVNSALARLAHQLVSQDLSLGEVANSVLDLAQGITGSRDGFVASLDQASKEMVCHAFTAKMGQGCFTVGLEGRTVFPCGPDGLYRGLCGHALNLARAFFSNDPAHHPEFLGLPPGHAPIANFLAAPVVMAGELVGQIALANSDRLFDPRTLAAVGRLGELYALALHNLRAQDERARLAAQLRHSQKMEALGALAGGVAHDFNNILGTILGFTEIALEENRQGNPAAQDLTNVLAVCQRAKDLVARILSFSRPEREGREPVDLAALLEEICQVLRVTLPSTVNIECLLDSK